MKILRVRLSGREARIEVSPIERQAFFDNHVIDMVDQELRRLGFSRVALDLRGYPRTEQNTAVTPLVLPIANAPR